MTTIDKAIAEENTATLKVTVNPVLFKDETDCQCLQLVTDINGQISSKVVNLEEEAIKSALIKLGWKPPEALKEIKEDCGCGHPDRHRQTERRELLGGGFGHYCRYCLGLRKPVDALKESVGDVEVEETFPIAEIERFVEYHKTQKTAAQYLNISVQYLCDILQGRREVSDNIASKFGWRRAWIRNSERCLLHTQQSSGTD